MDFLIRFSQVHESFRKPEIEALAQLFDLEYQWIHYKEYSPFAIIQLSSASSARLLIQRCILAKSIHHLWGHGSTYPDLHTSVHNLTSLQWPTYQRSSFRFDIETYLSSRTSSSHRTLINSFSYLNFQGPIDLKTPDQIFTIFEDYSDPSLSQHEQETSRGRPPTTLYFGRLLAVSTRLPTLQKYSLKTRRYLSTTSMDSELALLTANLTLSSPGKIIYDPFVGTGSLIIAAAHFGAQVLGSDIDGRMIRGKPAASSSTTTTGKTHAPNRDNEGATNVLSNFHQYSLLANYLDGFIADLTHSPLRSGRYLDGILCDPPYGVREGLRVLGLRPDTSRAINGKDRNRQGMHTTPDGEPAYLREGYIPPKKPYSFERMLHDILGFAAEKLVDGGRLSLWMPVANEAVVVVEEEENKEKQKKDCGEAAQEEREDEGTTEEKKLPDESKVGAGNEYAIPAHPCLVLKSCCVQDFNRWSRRLLTYERLRDEEVPFEALQKLTLDTDDWQAAGKGTTADELNPFRKRYFEGFRSPQQLREDVEVEGKDSGR